MRYGLDIVAVRIENESAVIILVIMGSQSGGAIVTRAGSNCRFIEGVDFLAIGRGKGNVQAAFQRRSGPDPELRPLAAETGVSVGAVVG